MAAYDTLDYLPDLTATQMAEARGLSFEPYTAFSNDWDIQASVYGSNKYALLHSVYKFNAIEGASYDIASTSFFDPFILRVFDDKGNTLAANNDSSHYSYGTDWIWDWIAPYSGEFYVDASWDQGVYHTFYSLNIYGDLDTVTPSDTAAPIVLNFNPSDNSTGVGIGGNIALTFNEPIQKGSGLIYLRSGSATGVIVESYDVANSSRISTVGSTLAIDPTVDLAYDTQYFVTLGSGVIKDLVGNNYAGTSAYDFRTIGNTVTNIAGTNAANFFTSSSQNERFDGKGGIDIVRYDGLIREYVVDLYLGTVTDSQPNRDGVDTLISIERLQFTDTNLALDINSVAGQAYRIYKAAFDRTPDLPGLGYWINDMDNGASLEAVAGGFIASDEFRLRYGSNTSDKDFIKLLYENVLDRQPDAAGYDYWQKDMANGMTRSKMLINFSESEENIRNVADLIENGIEYTPFIS